jgi:hypothetical protein
MNELDEAWAEMLAGAIRNAQTSGRADVADYLALKQSNDLIRQTSVTWLFDSLIEIASEASRYNPAILIEREEPHEFPFQNARMAGGLITISLGVRRMTIEAGWTRLPSHGFMRNAALAAARITHFGMPKSGADLVLMRKDETPVWMIVDGGAFDLENLRRHFGVFIGE